MKYKTFFFLFLFSTFSNASINVDRTRMVFNEVGGRQSFSVVNDDDSKTYLVQSWFEDEKGKKIKYQESPLIITPPLIRMESDSRNRITISPTEKAKNLQRDRESMFFINIRGIPQKIDSDRSFQIVTQLVMRLFYRPKTLFRKPSEFNIDSLEIESSNSLFLVKNPSPYYVSIVGFSDKENDKSQEGFTPFLMSPYSEVTLKKNKMDKSKILWITVINDVGGRFQTKKHIT